MVSINTPLRQNPIPVQVQAHHCFVDVTHTHTYSARAVSSGAEYRALQLFVLQGEDGGGTGGFLIHQGLCQPLQRPSPSPLTALDPSIHACIIFGLLFCHMVQYPTDSQRGHSEVFMH